MRIALSVALGLTLSVTHARAVMNDHLQCFKITDLTLKSLKGTVNLNAPAIGLAAGCKLSKAQLWCTPASKTVISAVNGTTPVTPLPYTGPAASGDRVCYKVTCTNPAGTGPDQTITDQFGTRTLMKLKTGMLCTPANTGSGYCGNGTLDGGEVCEGGNLGGATCQTLGFASGTLGCTASCEFNTGACVATTVPGCGNGVREGAEQCDGGDLGGATCTSLGYTKGGTLGCAAGCGFDASGCNSQKNPATGQVTCSDMVGATIACTGTGQDGEFQRGAVLTYVDNGLTITDLNTGLEWEKLSDDGSIHDQDNAYAWDDAVNVKVAALNSASFAGHNDWRLPNVKELVGILDYGTANPAVPVAFRLACAPGCSLPSCSCTAAVSGFYWSSTSRINMGQNAWLVGLQTGAIVESNKFIINFTRAVRGGF